MLKKSSPKPHHLLSDIVESLKKECHRNGKSVTHETLGNLAHLPDHLLDLIKRSLKGKPSPPPPRRSGSRARCHTAMSRRSGK